MEHLIAEVLTHIIAFLLLFVVLRRYAWKPLLCLLDERRSTIAGQFETAEARQREAEELHRRYDELIRKIDEESRARLNEAIAQGRLIAQETTEKARQEAREIAEKARRNIEIELDQARIDLKNRMVDLTIQSTERLLRERMDEAKHRELVARFIEELETRQA